MPKNQFVKGMSGNPAGRKTIALDIRRLMMTNAELAVQRLHTLMKDDDAFGKEGWMDPKQQLCAFALAMDRGLGKSEHISITHTHGGNIALTARLRDIEMPEKKAQERIIDAKVVSQVPADGGPTPLPLGESRASGDADHWEEGT